MKYLYIVMGILAVLILTHQVSAAEPSTASDSTIVVRQFDIGGNVKITGKGTSVNDARSDASRKCFDQRVAEFLRLRGQLPEGEQADLIIESCVNI